MKWYERNRQYDRPEMCDEFGHRWSLYSTTGTVRVSPKSGCSDGQWFPLENLEWTLTRNQKNINTMLIAIAKQNVASLLATT